MDDFNELLRPGWGSEKWILEGWEKINSEDRNLIKSRMDELFKDGLPFEIKHDKLLYVYAFSLLAQLEVLAIQIPLKFKDKMVSQENKDRMHLQLLDEIFHGLVFTKILYMLCDPYSMPPIYNEQVEELCNYVRNEDSPQVAVILLNLIAEGWIEEAFKCYSKQNIAPKVFDTILADEHRHVCEADLYHDVGMPDMEVVKHKLEFFEEHLLVNFFLQHKYVAAVSALVGMEGAADFVHSLNKKHLHQLSKINLQPSKKWVVFMQVMQSILPKVRAYVDANYEVEMTPIRKMLAAQWNNSSAATMVSQSNINVSCVDFFSKKFPPETLTTLMLQSVSLWLMENAVYRSYFHFKKLFQSKNAYVGVIVQLPGCRDQIGTIAFENCHEMSALELAQRIRDIMEVMIYCYKKREELEQTYPDVAFYDESQIYDFANDIYGYPLPGSSIITVSNVGPWGYTGAKSPLLKNEAVKFVMLQVERKQVWSKESQTFEIQDHLPISISADHRIFDGNTPVPRMLNDTFQRSFKNMLNDIKKPKQTRKAFDATDFKKAVDGLVHLNVEFAHKYLTVLHTVWADFLSPEELLAPLATIKATAKMLT